MALYTVIGLGFSLLLFAGVRSFAKPPPHTMTKEWQEATNEYLKVRRHCSEFYGVRWTTTNITLPTGPKVGPSHRSHLGRLFGQGPRAVPSGEGIKRIRFLLSIDATSCTGDCSCLGSWRRMVRAAEHGGLQGLILDGVNTVQREQCDFVSLLLPQWILSRSERSSATPVATSILS